ncbi:MAG: hypothetical protein C5S46_00355 [Candidatus Methanomarinus sp.]|uniref:Uncharacterized protein n=1 Tax=Candidatus Methanomarinus sp. TaxID=3386244 RepID=A0AC61SCT4_9EURY|nr:DUF5320 domain-containing protein [Euryarchaeota archaeon]PPA79171.1 MAG: hypothetical protein C00003105_01363 [ANME-2 cluster archaeon HR1]TKY92501.1 MAG: hypothetical protein C5S46_00355 [ANME-2 cluster archaeon]
MRGGNRNMYYATGLPGWMRLGYSPGWVGRSPGGLPPTAQYLRTGTWPALQQQVQWQGMPVGMPAISEQQELSMLESQAAALEQQLEQIKNRLQELKK